MNHENDSNEAKLIIKMRQMDQNEWVECAKIIQSQQNEANRENLVIEMFQMDQNESSK